MVQPSRKFSAGSGYRYGFNGKELDKEIAGTTTYDYGFRIYNPGLVRFLSVDPLTSKYPWYTPYQFAGNKPIENLDIDGQEDYNYSLVLKKQNDGKQYLAIQFDKKVEWDFVDNIVNANKCNCTELHNLYYKGELIAQFGSLQDLKTISYGKSAEEINKIGLENEGNQITKLALLHTLAESLREPENPTKYSTAKKWFSNGTNQESEEETVTPPVTTNTQQSTTGNRIKTLATNKSNSLASESIVKQKLTTELKENEAILDKPRIYIGDGSTGKYAQPDFAVYNTKTGQFVKLVDAKDGNAGLTNAQKDINQYGGTFKGSSRAKKAAPQKVAPGANRIQVERTNVAAGG